MTASSQLSSASRAERVRGFLRDQQLRAWIAWRPDELVMLAGYLPYWGVSVLIHPLEVDPILFVPAIEPHDHIPAGLHVREYPWGLLGCADPFGMLLHDIRSALKDSLVKPSEVGLVARASRTALPVLAAEQPPMPDSFRTELLQLGIRSGPALESAFFELYLRKSAEEVDAIRTANRVALAGIRAFEESLSPGISEAALAATVESAIQTQTGNGAVYYARGWAMVQSGANSADAGRFNRSTGRRLQSGDLVLLELATCVNGYWSDLTRTTVLGGARPELHAIVAAVQEAQQAAVDAVGPCVSASEIDAIARDHLARQGLSDCFTHHTGHHVGFRYHDPGFIIAPGERRRLEPGMVITIEPGVYSHERGGGARVEDNVLVTESGHEVLSRAA